MTAEVQDKEDGSYAVSYTATVAGVYELHITLGAGYEIRAQSAMDYLAGSAYVIGSWLSLVWSGRKWASLVSNVEPPPATPGVCSAAGDEHVAHSPYPLRVLPAKPSARRSVVSGSGRSAALAGSPAHFTIASCDEHGNR